MVKYINRKGDTYYLHKGKTKTGKPRYTFSQKEDGTLVETIPDGYEIYENPNGRVYLRKISPEIITDEEVSIVENGISSLSKLEDFKIVVKKNQIIIYVPDQDFETFAEPFKDYVTVSYSKMKEIYKKSVYYSEEMRFVLIDRKKRDFRVDRMCYRGEIDWLELDFGNLRELVSKYCPHLGRESFYELI